MVLIRMSCNCLLRSVSRASLAPRFSARRTFISSTNSRAAAPAQTAAKASTSSTPPTSATASSSSTSSTIVSSCPEGTKLTGLNYKKEGSDPIAKADSEYPPWLWNLLTPRASNKSEITTKHEELLQQKLSLKKKNKVAIRAKNTLKG